MLLLNSWLRRCDFSCLFIADLSLLVLPFLALLQSIAAENYPFCELLTDFMGDGCLTAVLPWQQQQQRMNGGTESVSRQAAIMAVRMLTHQELVAHARRHQQQRGHTQLRLRPCVVGLHCVAARPAGTIDPNESRCAVPDERYDFLCDMWQPPSK